MSIVDRPAAGRIAALAVRLLAGRSTWGRFDVWPSRYGITHYRLIVLPPGSTATDRALLGLWRAAPIIAAVVGFGLILAADDVHLPAQEGAAAGVVAAATVLLALGLPTRRLRPLVRTRSGWVDDLGGRAPVDQVPAIEQWAAFLLAADAAAAVGGITVPQHEVAWTTAWLALGPIDPVR